MPNVRKIRFLLLLCACLTAACGSVMRKATQQFSDNLTTAILDQDDVATAHDGVPAYLRPAEAEILYPDGVPGALRRRP